MDRDMKLSHETFLHRAAYIAQTIAGLWFLAIAVLEDVALQARLARLAVALACIANLREFGG